MTTPAMEHARDCALIAALIAALCSLIGVPIVLMLHAFPRLFQWRRGQAAAGERERLEQTEETAEAVRGQVAAQVRRRVDATLAELRAAQEEEMGAMRRAMAAECRELAEQMSRRAMAAERRELAGHISRHVDAALAEHRATLQQEMGAMRGAIAETVTDLRAEVRSLKKDVEEMRRGPDEGVLRPGSEQRPADRPGALVAATRSRGASADAADVPALHTAAGSSGTSRANRDTLESQSRSPVALGKAAAQGAIRQVGPRHAAQAAPSAARGPLAWGSSHDQHVRVDPTPTPVPGISRGRATRTWQEARGSQSTAPALPQSWPSSAGEEAGSAVTRAPAHPADSEAPVARRKHLAARAAEGPSSLERVSQRRSSEPSLQLAAGAPARASLPMPTARSLASHSQASFSASGPLPLLPVAAAAEAPGARSQRTQERQRRYPPLSALLDGMEHQGRAAPTHGSQRRAALTRSRQSLSSGSLFYAEVVRRHVREEARNRGQEQEREEEEEARGGWVGWFEQMNLGRMV